MGTTVDIPVCQNKEFNFLAKLPKTVTQLTNNGTDIKNKLENRASMLFV